MLSVVEIIDPPWSGQSAVQLTSKCQLLFCHCTVSVSPKTNSRKRNQNGCGSVVQVGDRNHVVAKQPPRSTLLSVDVVEELKQAVSPTHVGFIFCTQGQSVFLLGFYYLHPSFLSLSLPPPPHLWRILMLVKWAFLLFLES